MVLVLVSQAIVADTGHHVLASTGFSGVGDGILHRAVTQPAGIAPVHISSPGVIQLVKRGHDGILVMTRPLSVVEIEVVATQTGVVGEDNTCVESRDTDKIDEQQLRGKTRIFPLGFVFSVVI